MSCFSFGSGYGILPVSGSVDGRKVKQRTARRRMSAYTHHERTISNSTRRRNSMKQPESFEKQVENAEALLPDDALDVVSGGSRRQRLSGYCALCHTQHLLMEYYPWPVKYNRKRYIGTKYSCSVRGTDFFEMTDPATGQPIYFDSGMNRIGSERNTNRRRARGGPCVACMGGAVK